MFDFSELNILFLAPHTDDVELGPWRDTREVYRR